MTFERVTRSQLAALEFGNTIVLTLNQRIVELSSFENVIVVQGKVILNSAPTDG